MELAVLHQSFNGFDFFAAACGGEGQARADQPAIDDHATRAAHADAATFLGAGQTDGVAKNLEQ
jgi:hypothetical protein